MKIFSTVIFLFLLFFTPIAFGQSIDLLGSLNPYPSLDYAEVWGYEQGGVEYALMGVSGGTTIIDVTDPGMPVEVAFVPGPFAPQYEWRDMKIHLHYAYVVTEGGGTGSGMQIIDLSMLPDTAILVNTYNSTFTTAHNLYIDNGFAYVVGANPGSGVHILDLSDPINPIETSYYSKHQYVHDVYVYNDTMYISSSNDYAVVDVSNKNSPDSVSTSAILPGIYAHQGWLSEDKRYFFATEEFNVRDLTVWDLQDRNTWNLVVSEWQLNTNSYIHNAFVLGDYLHISYYTSGYVVLNISDPTNPKFAARYDTYPQNDNTVYDGSWGVYPYLPSGNVLVSDMSTGLYICRFNPAVTSVDDNTLPKQFELQQNYPNPFNPATTISFNLNESGFVKLKIFNSLGEEVQTLVQNNLEAGKHTVNFNASSLPSGIYLAHLEAGNEISTIKMSLLK